MKKTVSIKQRKVTFTGATGRKELTIDYSKEASTVIRAMVEPIPHSRFMNACPLMPRGDKVEIDAGDGDLFLFDPKREVLWWTGTYARPDFEVGAADDSRDQSGDDLERFMDVLLD